jgi:hypothetical protein
MLVNYKKGPEQLRKISSSESLRKNRDNHLGGVHIHTPKSTYSLSAV